jgi:adenylate cyclase
MSATRRLAAILAADVAGYSRLIGVDEEGTLERLKAVRAELIDPAIAEHRGRIVKTTGDGLLVEFRSVVDALRCASQLQQQMAERNIAVSNDDRIEFRIGVHQGDIVVDADDIFGDGVNVAARLEGLAHPGGICVSARVQEDAAGRLELTFDDLGEQALKNIARPVRVYRVRLATAGTAPTAALVEPAPSLPLPDKPSIAVLPFANMSNDPEQEFFADGIAEDIITALSRYPSLFVIARNSCFTYKGRAVDVKEVGHELGVRYVLEGSLRKSDNRIRVTAQLIEAESGNHLWADRYDRDLAHIFAIQDEITEAVTIAIAPAIAGAEQKRAMRKPPDSLDAWAAYQRGLWHLNQFSATENPTAECFFRQAADLDPKFAGAYKGLSWAYHQATALRIREFDEALHASEVAARRAVSLDSADAEAYSCLAQALCTLGNHGGGIAEAKHALAMAPNLSEAHGALGSALIFSGRAAVGIASVETCIRLDPQGPLTAVRVNLITIGLYFSGEYSAAAQAANRAIRSHPHYAHPYRWLAAALGQLECTSEATEALRQAAGVAAGRFDLFVRQRRPWMRPEDHAHMVEGLRKAGWEG